MNAPEKCPKCGAGHRVHREAGSLMPSRTPFAINTRNIVEENEFTCGSRFAVDGSSIDQSGLCLMGERDALRAELAALKVENERITTNAFNLSSLIEEVAENVGILSDGMPANDDATERLEIRGDGWSIEGMQGLLVEYVAALKAERAGMVTREGSLLRFAGLILFAWFDDEIKGMHGDCFAGVIDFHLTDWAKQCGLMESIPEVYNRARATDLGKTALARAEAEANAGPAEKGGIE